MIGCRPTPAQRKINECVKQLTPVRFHIAYAKRKSRPSLHRGDNRRSWILTVSRRLRRPDQLRENTMLHTFLIGAVSALTLTAAAADETVISRPSCTTLSSSLRKLATWTITLCHSPDIRD